ncbi:MAG: hypothetical protein IH853_12865 [Bacteroidetes bacterium]|nr:hypothetical protein [Bacteroidota bacterium]
MVFLMLVAAKGEFDLADKLLVTLFTAVGLGSAGITAFRLPRWARERAHQMEEIGARAVELVGGKTAKALRDVEPSPRLDLEMQTEPTLTEPTEIEPTNTENTRTQNRIRI